MRGQEEKILHKWQLDAATALPAITRLLTYYFTFQYVSFQYVSAFTSRHQNEHSYVA